MPLYKIETVHVPVCLYEESHDYTQIKMFIDYIGIQGDNCVQLNNEKLGFCRNLDSLYICDDPILQIDKFLLTCAASIFWDMDGYVIKNTCEFEFYHDYILTAEVLHSDKQLLLANVATRWKLICSEKSTPIRYHGERYVTVDRNDLCSRGISTVSHFISPTITWCPNVSSKLHLSFSVNAAMIMYFKDKIDSLILESFTVKYQNLISKA